MGWAQSGVLSAHARTNVHSYTRTLCIIAEALLLPVCVPPHFALVSDGRSHRVCEWRAFNGRHLALSCRDFDDCCICFYGLHLLYTPGVSAVNKTKPPLRSLTNERSRSVSRWACRAQLWADGGNGTGTKAALREVMEIKKIGQISDIVLCKQKEQAYRPNIFFFFHGWGKSSSSWLHMYTVTACFPNWQNLPGIIHGMHPMCMCDTCFFIQSSCLFIFCHHHNASCYFLPSSVQTNNRCEKLEHSLPLSVSACPVLRLVCDNLCTFDLSSSPIFPEACPSLVCYVGTKKKKAAPISHSVFLE